MNAQRPMKEILRDLLAVVIAMDGPGCDDAQYQAAVSAARAALRRKPGVFGLDKRGVCGRCREQIAPNLNQGSSE